MKNSEVAVLIEDFQSQFRTFGERLDNVDRKIDIVTNQVGRLTEDMFIVKTDIRIMKTDIAEIKSMVHNHDKRISRIEAIQ